MGRDLGVFSSMENLSFLVPQVGDRVYHESERLWYVYTGPTRNWLSESVFDFPVERITGRANPIGSNGDIAHTSGGGGFSTKRILVSWSVWYLVVTTNNASNFWTVTWSGTDSFTTASDAPNVWAVRHAADQTYYNSTSPPVNISVVLTGAPGTLYVVPRMTFRVELA